MTLTLTAPDLTFELPNITGAPCTGLVDVFFPSPVLKADERNSLVTRAKALCASCEFVDVCFAGAIDRAEVEGVWGGHLFRDGQIITGYTGPGRPRKLQTCNG
jgi:hypothetical protein